MLVLLLDDGQVYKIIRLCTSFRNFGRFVTFNDKTHDLKLMRVIVAITPRHKNDLLIMAALAGYAYSLILRSHKVDVTRSISFIQFNFSTLIDLVHFLIHFHFLLIFLHTLILARVHGLCQYPVCANVCAGAKTSHFPPLSISTALNRLNDQYLSKARIPQRCQDSATQQKVEKTQLRFVQSTTLFQQL